VITRQLTAGIDPGSSAVKVAVTASQAGDDAELLGVAVERIRRRHVRDVVAQTFEKACMAAGVEPAQLDYVASTGDGDSVDFRTGHFYSMTTHGRGALFLHPETLAVMDIGALHARGIRVDSRGRVLGHRMTSQCASGTGQFLENIARYLGVPLEDVGELSCSASQPEKVSGICAVLAETDVINMVSRGIATPDILKGIHQSIAGRLILLLRSIGAAGVVTLTGGLARDTGMVAALRELVADEQSKGNARIATLEIRNHPDSMLAGAIGAALLGAYRRRQLEQAGRAELVA
jgi:benzoyl-CoA reductase subunit D